MVSKTFTFSLHNSNFDLIYISLADDEHSFHSYETPPTFQIALHFRGRGGALKVRGKRNFLRAPRTFLKDIFHD